MKRLAMYLLLAGAMLSCGGCLGSPGYTPVERQRVIARTWSYEAGQAVDDWDHFWLLKPPGHMTQWNVR
jgi:hypothetical protein